MSDKIKLLLAVGVVLVAVIVTFVIFNKSSEDELEDVSEEVVSEQVSEELSDEKSNKVSVTIYSPNEDADGFVTSKATVDKVKPSNLLNEMVKKDPSLKGVRSLGFVQNKDHIEVNLSTEFQDALTKYGSSGEHYLMGSVVNTFLEACKAKTITIKIRGKYIETGHNVYDYPLEFYKD